MEKEIIIAKKLLEYDLDGNYLGLYGVRDLDEEDLNQDWIEQVNQLTFHPNPWIRFESTFTLLCWYQPEGLKACLRLLEEDILSHYDSGYHHRLWGQDCGYEELAFVSFGVIESKLENEVLKRFLSPGIYGRYHFIEGMFIAKFVPENGFCSKDRIIRFKGNLQEAMEASFSSSELHYPELQASYCLEPLVAMRIDEPVKLLERFFYLPEKKPDARYQAIRAAKHLADGKEVLRHWLSKTEDELLTRWIQNTLRDLTKK
ncbi:hypothetical protein [Thermoactinomyces mirandus]|uniref:Uncharacterized protein n=1 Tax=Thermoactinomyces mirandus TaxID=2756294 RepID=A0A7W1XVC5_9BACL|nr:hypothetical protein [Thermoactinomyces mirandus]MBA4603670.1 hypothetical protein [Thermoactinomyces mirandus]